MRTNGIVIVNKPAGPTSQQTVTRVRRLLSADKAGHSGSLDPGTTGVLPVFLGCATRLSEYVMQERKAYEAEMQFGAATDTQDASGRVIAAGDPGRLTEAAVRRAAQSFVGEIRQAPPAYSAVKVNGERAYDLARRGVAFSLPERPVRVYSLTVLDVDLAPGSFRVRFAVECGKGTYVRAICHDMGVLLGVPAHMTALVRTRSGPFSLAAAHSLEEIAERPGEVVLPPAAAVAHLPAVSVDGETAAAVRHGAPFAWRREPDAPAACGSRGGAPFCDPPAADAGNPERRVRVHRAGDGELLAIYRWAGGAPAERARLVAEKVLAAGGCER